MGAQVSATREENYYSNGGEGNEQAWKEGAGSGHVPFLLAERARSECARPMRTVKGSLGHSAKVRCGEIESCSVILLEAVGTALK